MQLGETIATYDVDLALRGETGKFEVKSPNGEVHYLTCRPNRFFGKSEPTAEQLSSRSFLIKKIAELVELNETSALHSPALRLETPTSVSATPFLMENRSEAETAMSGLASSAEESHNLPVEAPRLRNIELSYSESKDQTKQPCAFVYVENAPVDSMGASSQSLLTNQCANFNELDAEIRRLHAQLDQICLRAKKNFYKAYAAAASA